MVLNLMLNVLLAAACILSPSSRTATDELNQHTSMVSDLISLTYIAIANANIIKKHEAKPRRTPTSAYVFEAFIALRRRNRISDVGERLCLMISGTVGGGGILSIVARWIWIV